MDGAKLKSAKSPAWRRDDRLPANEQTLAEIYGKVPGKAIQIDRGHLVRRLDPVWGRSGSCRPRRERHLPLYERCAAGTHLQ
ncbi:DNA/RNA non-specific endonuclease [Rhizobium beringeri]